MKKKKSTMGQVVVIFISILLISVMAGMTFLFVGSLKTETETLTRTGSVTITNETNGYINATGYTLSVENDASFVLPQGYTISSIYNGTNATGGYTGSILLIASGNYTVDGVTGLVTNASTDNWANVTISYTADFIPLDKASAYRSVNTTEGAGMTVTNFLTILFLAMIFSAILTVVLRFVLPFINVGNRLDGF